MNILCIIGKYLIVDIDFNLGSNAEWVATHVLPCRGSLILLKGGDLKQPALQRFPYPLPDSSHRSLLLTLDLVTEDVKEM